MKNKMKKTEKSLMGTVTSDKMDKTIVVRVKRTAVHPVFKKHISRHTKFKAHDEKNEAKLNDVVKIKQSRPISRDKQWTLVSVVERAR